MTFQHRPATTKGSVDIDCENAGCIALEKLPNTRDLGYLSLASGQKVRFHRLIRSGALSDASSTDVNTLVEGCDIRAVVDLRTSDEQKKRPDPKDRMNGVSFIDAPILGYSSTGVTRENGLSGFAKELAGFDRDPKQVMLDLYPKMLLGDTGVQGYTQFFETLVHNNDGAVLWHCTAGKDRAGLASVLLLYVLGVSWDAIVSDYLATNRFIARRIDDIKILIPEEHRTDDLLKKLQVLNSADAAFLDSGVRGVEKEYGSLTAYIKEALGVDEEAQAWLREKYLY